MWLERPLERVGQCSCSIASDERVQREIIREDLSLEPSSALGKKEKNRRWPKKKKLASKASREVVWGAFPIPRLSLGSLRLPILFPFDPVFCLPPPPCGALSKARQIFSVSAVVYPCLVVEGYSRRCHNDQIMKDLKCCEQVLLPLL